MIKKMVDRSCELGHKESLKRSKAIMSFSDKDLNSCKSLNFKNLSFRFRKKTSKNGEFMSKKTLVLDAPTLLSDPELFFSYKDCSFVLPNSTLEELDKRRHKGDEVAKNIFDVINEHLDGKADGECSQIKVHFEEEGANKNIDFATDRRRLGVLRAAHSLLEKGEAVSICSKDPITKLLAKSIGVETHQHKPSENRKKTFHVGIPSLEVEKKHIDNFFLNGKVTLPNIEFAPNDFVHLRSEFNSHVLCRYDGEKKALVRVQDKLSLFGIRPLNDEQRCAADLLLRDNINLVTFIGAAGTGKTLLALAAGLKKVFDEGKYHRLIIARSIMPLGKDIGFLPGTKEEKMKSWLGAFFDNLQFICNQEDAKTGQEMKKWILESEKFEVEAVTYMRGRSISDAFIIIDEAQNLTRHELKTIISRVGHNTKIVVLGDPSQIDHPHLDPSLNGLIYLANKMKRYPIYGSVHFEKTERSPLAALAANIL